MQAEIDESISECAQLKQNIENFWLIMMILININLIMFKVLTTFTFALGVYSYNYNLLPYLFYYLESKIQ